MLYTKLTFGVNLKFPWDFSAEVKKKNHNSYTQDFPCPEYTNPPAVAEAWHFFVPQSAAFPLTSHNKGDCEINTIPSYIHALPVTTRPTISMTQLGFGK